MIAEHQDSKQVESTLLLVHGGWCSSWVWELLLPELQVATKVIDLPGHAADGRRMWSVTLNDYADAVIDVANSIDGRVILVGHSSGGFVISAAAGKNPSAFDELVYLAAMVPINGERLMQLALKNASPVMNSGIRPNPLRGFISLHQSVSHDALYHDCSEEIETRASSRSEAEPLRPGIAKLKLSNGFYSLPKSYILCTEDNAIPPESQRSMASRSDVPIKFELNTGHMPMYAAPKQLATILTAYAKGEVE